MSPILLFGILCQHTETVSAQEWPTLPSANAAVLIPAQEWPARPGPRTVRVLVHYPGNKLDNVKPDTGLMLTLHNWGGTDCAGTANPKALANRLNVVAICVNYLQSGRKASIEDPEPYDFGYLQGLDALRALFFVFDGLQKLDRPFAAGRVYATGGSGGGNVTLMANKLAPRTFACVIDMCGMPKLSHDIAFNLPGGSGLDARWSRDPNSPNYLSVDEQEMRFVGNPLHLRGMRELKTSAKIVVVHGADDRTCPFPDAQEMVANMQAAGFDVEARFIRKTDLDGRVFTSSGHALGNRSEIPFRVAGKYLLPGSPTAVIRKGPTDFERRDTQVRYPTTNGEFVVSYETGYPIGKFEKEKLPIPYDEHQDLTYYKNRTGQRHTIKNVSDWETRRQHILANMQVVIGKLPGPTSRVSLNVRFDERVQVEKLWRHKINYQTDPYDRVAAYLFTPRQTDGRKLPAILCLHQTARAGKDEPAGLTGKTTMHYGIELARRGYVVLMPDYPSMGEHNYDFDAKYGYISGTMKAIWDNVRSVDLLQSLEYVDGNRIGCIGHSLGGHSAIFTAAFEPRIKVIVSSCGFTRFHKDDMPSWTSPKYMPLIASKFGNDADRVPFDFTEIVGSFAPRPFLACAAVHDRDFDVSGVRDVMASARKAYELYGQADRLTGFYPDTPHDFPDDARETAYRFLDKYLK